MTAKQLIFKIKSYKGIPYWYDNREKVWKLLVNGQELNGGDLKQTVGYIDFLMGE